MQDFNVLVFSHFIEGNRVFEDYCNGIKEHSSNYHYIDYLTQYLTLGKDRFEALIEKTVHENDINHIFFIWWSSDVTFELSFIEKLSRKAKIVINYYDTEYFFEGIDRYYAQLADLVILPDCLSRYKYLQLNINTISTFALYDQNSYKRDPSLEKDIDVSFVGNLKQSDRKEYVEFLQKNGIEVDTYGVDSKHGFISFEEMIKVFNRSKINLNFTMTSDRSSYVINPPKISQRIRQSKGRPNEIALSGGFILSQYAPGIEEMYEIGQEIDVFKTKEELLNKIKQYLAEDSGRTQMAERAHMRALNNYSASAGFQKVFYKLSETNPFSEKTTYTDPEFIENFASFRFYYIIQFILNGNLGNIIPELRILLKYKKISIKKSYYFAIKGLLVYLRSRPKIEQHFKTIKNKLKIKIKY